MKGILLAGGKGSRLNPMTFAVNKHLLPVYDKPMIYYSMSILMLGGIRDIALISNPEDQHLFQRLFGDGSRLGLNITYFVQEEARGIPDAFLITQDWLQDDDVCLILGDNIFFGESFGHKLSSAISELNGATIFTQQVNNPQRFGVACFDEHDNITSLHEKPKEFISNHAITGLYLFDNQVAQFAANTCPSGRGELEIMDVLEQYRQQQRLSHTTLGRGFAWLDAGTAESLLEAGSCIHTIEKMQGLKIACLEELAVRQGWCDKATILQHQANQSQSAYDLYVQKILEQM